MAKTTSWARSCSFTIARLAAIYLVILAGLAAALLRRRDIS